MESSTDQKRTGTICHFGTFSTEQQYSHNALVGQVLADKGWTIHECRTDNISASDRVKSFSGILGLLSAILTLIKQWCSLWLRHWKTPAYDIMIVGYPSHADMFLAYVLCKWRRKPLVMDAFYGLYNTVVEDRKLISSKNPLSKIIHIWENCVLHMADCVLIDTQSQANMLEIRYKLKPESIVSLPVGIDESIWKPVPSSCEGEPFRVAVWATFIPLHGMNTIVKAAALLQKLDYNIEIKVCGDGQTADEFSELLDELNPHNIHWNRELFPMEHINKLAQNTHCCIGILGDSDKAKRVIPYKVTQALAVGRAVITAESTETEQLLQHEQDALLIEANNPQTLCDAIARLAQDRPLCASMGQNGRKVYEQHLSNERMQSILDETCRNLLPQ